MAVNNITANLLDYSNLNYFDCETNNVAYVNQGQIRSLNQPELSNDSEI